MPTTKPTLNSADIKLLEKTFSTKEDVSRAVTSIVRYVDQKTTALQEQIDQKTASLQDQIKHLPTKEEYYTQSDKIIKEIQDSRTESIVLTHQVADVRDRVETIETKLGIIPN